MPVVLVDESDSPCISSQLLRDVSRPEVRLCLRKYGFRDTASYFRCDNYYEEVYHQLSAHDSPPDHFPVHDDDPVGDVIRKIRVCVPVICEKIPEEAPALVDRRIDVLFVENCDDERTECLRRRWISLPGLRKAWVREGEYDLSELLDIFRDTRVFVSSNTFSRYDFYAAASGCVVIKPECSNVRSLVDIFDPSKLCVWYCDANFKELPSMMSYVLKHLDVWCCEGPSLFNNTVERWASSFQEACRDVVSERYPVGDVCNPLPLV
jgi:hypothetical protein